jgi:hypothetical protein
MSGRAGQTPWELRRLIQHCKMSLQTLAVGCDDIFYNARFERVSRNVGNVPNLPNVPNGRSKDRERNGP